MCPGTPPRDNPEEIADSAEETSEQVTSECTDLSASVSTAHFFSPCMHSFEDHKDHSSVSPGSVSRERSPRIQTNFHSRQRSSKKSKHSFYELYPYFLLYLFGSSSFQPNLNTSESHVGLIKKLTPDTTMENSREFFDPMVGNFKSSLNSASDFFTSKLRFVN
jgi:hypothetical protein